MDWQIRLAIVLVGALLIGYIFFDFRRKKKRQLENERLKRQFSQDPDQVDAAGFDLTGVGTARRIVKSDQIETKVDSDSETSSKPKATDKVSKKNIKQEPIISIDQIELGESIDDYILERSLPKGHRIKNKVVETTGTLNSKKNSQPNAEQKNQNSEQVPELILSLILQAENNRSYRGSQLIPLLLSQGLTHGEFNIFHKYQDKDTSETNKGLSLYSLANAFNPGSFDLNNIDSIETTALAAFVRMPGPEQPLQAYNSMLKTIEFLQKELGGKVLDENRSSYTQQTHNHRIELIQDYLNKH
ncbi:MAG: cell division protein ZipA [Enterobacterales bacterium]|nr:cell division protein ZipA [Enterobacterales bacterium]